LQFFIILAFYCHNKLLLEHADIGSSKAHRAARSSAESFGCYPKNPADAGWFFHKSDYGGLFIILLMHIECLVMYEYIADDCDCH